MMQLQVTAGEAVGGAKKKKKKKKVGIIYIQVGQIWRQVGTVPSHTHGEGGGEREREKKFKLKEKLRG